MKLQRYTAFEVWDAGGEDNYAGGHVYRAADVDAMLADIAAADRLARGVDESHRAFSAYQDAGWDTDADTAAYNDTMDKLGAHAEAADDEATAAHLAYRDRMQGVARGE